MEYKENLYRSADGLELYYREYGGGDQAVVCLHGLSRNCKDFHDLALHLSEEQLKAALATVQAIEDEWRQVGALMDLAPHLPEEQLKAALVAAQAIEDEGLWAFALKEKAPSAVVVACPDRLTSYGSAPVP